MVEAASGPPCHVARWRAATIGCLLVLGFAVAAGISMFEQFKAQVQHLQGKLQTTARIKYIAVLLDAQQGAAMLVTFDPQDRALQIQRLNAVAEGRDDSMQLWALPAHGKPRSLGVLESSGKTLRLSVEEQSMAGALHLAISVEGKGGSAPGSGPSLPFLFKGAAVQKAL